MKILFLCGSCEAGKDGVGDYTRKLAHRLSFLGHKIAIVALNDRYIHQSNQLEEVVENNVIYTMRLSAKEPWAERMHVATNWVHQFSADWVSLQYVPFSFDKRGLAFSLPEKIKTLVAGSRFHIMFHEVWVGLDINAGMKMRIMGLLQKLILKNLVKKNKPSVLHTHSKFYKALLLDCNIKVAQLPLFGNILLGSNNTAIKQNTDETLSFIIFGSIHYGADVNSFCIWLKNNLRGKRVRIDFVGNNGESINEWLSGCKQNDLDYVVHGVKDVEYIAMLLRNASVGLTTTPYLLCEKSGTVAAMLEFGLPVLCVARSWVPRNNKLKHIDELPATLWNNNLKLEEVLQKRNYGFSVADIAGKLIQSLKTVEQNGIN